MNSNQERCLVLGVVIFSMCLPIRLMADHRNWCVKNKGSKEVVVQFQNHGAETRCEASYRDNKKNWKKYVLSKQGSAAECESEYQSYISKLTAQNYYCEHETVGAYQHSATTSTASTKTQTYQYPTSTAASTSPSEGTRSSASSVSANFATPSGSAGHVRMDFTISEFIQSLNTPFATGTYSSVFFNPAMSSWARYVFTNGWELGAYGSFASATYSAPTGDTLANNTRMLWTAGARIRQPIYEDISILYSVGMIRRTYVAQASATSHAIEAATIPNVGAEVIYPFLHQQWGSMALRGGGDFLLSGTTDLASSIKSGFMFHGGLALSSTVSGEPFTTLLYVERAMQNTSLFTQSSWEFGLSFGIDFNVAG